MSSAIRVTLTNELAESCQTATTFNNNLTCTAILKNVLVMIISCCTLVPFCIPCRRWNSHVRSAFILCHLNTERFIIISVGVRRNVCQQNSGQLHFNFCKKFRKRKITTIPCFAHLLQRMWKNKFHQNDNAVILCHCQKLLFNFCLKIRNRKIIFKIKTTTTNIFIDIRKNTPDLELYNSRS